MRSSADSRRATTAAASSRSLTPPWMPGSVLVSRSSASASAAARSASRRASSDSTHGVGCSGLKTTSVPAVRPLQTWGSGSIPPRSARTTTGCCWRMRISMRFSGRSKDRSSRNSEKSKPSSSLTGTKTASIGNSPPSLVRPDSWTLPGTRGGSPASRNIRQAWPAGDSAPPISVSKKLSPRISSAARPNSSSAGSDHFDTAPLPSVRTK